VNHDELERLIAIVGATRLENFEFKGEGQHLRLAFERRAAAPAKVIPLIESAKAVPVVKSPGMGIIRLTHPQQSEPFARTGDTVKKGQILAFLQYQDVLDAIISEHDGVLAKACVREGDVVGYADAIFELQ